jgi:mitochondrial ornithine carrier protein
MPLSALVLCGGLSGAVTSLLLTPIELVKCKVQVPAIRASEPLRPLNVSQVIHSVFRHQGILGFWHGQMATLIRETGGSAAWFGSYEAAKMVFLKRNSNAKTVDDLPIWQRMVSGAIAGMSYNFLFYPADTIKSRMQTEDVVQLGKKTISRGFWETARAMWTTHGVAGMYRGCGITVARAAPSSAVIFTVYEMLKEHVG